MKNISQIKLNKLYLAIIDKLKYNKKNSCSFLFTKEGYLMLINEVVNYCDLQYKTNCATLNYGQCDDSTCTHPSICPLNCEECLEQVHFPGRYSNGRLDYTCKNILNFYVCKYYHKYTSEIEYALNSINILPYKDILNIMSLGCGASPDLAAVENYLAKNNFPIPISYLGIDMNKRWENIHTLIKNYFNSPQYNIKYLYSDVIEIFQDHYANQMNILILQYLISHFYNTGKLNAVRQFYKSLITNVVKKMQEKSIIIINDVNSNRRGRDFFLLFSEMLTQYNIHHKCSCRYFEYNIQNDYQRYGIKYPTKDVLTWPQSNLAHYNPWTVCSSAQLIIELE